MIYYTGIGSRTTPEDIITEMADLASFFAARKFTLRSGGADGADLAFELGCNYAKGAKEIYLPWKRFNNSNSELHHIPDQAFVIAAAYHPAWTRLKEPSKKLMARNVQQVLGKNLDTPSSFVVCWTPDGCTSHETRSQKTGGTGQAISIASKSKILIFNLQHKDAIEQIEKFTMELE
jgi:hypothetical protein